MLTTQTSQRRTNFISPSSLPIFPSPPPQSAKLGITPQNPSGTTPLTALTKQHVRNALKRAAKVAVLNDELASLKLETSKRKHMSTTERADLVKNQVRRLLQRL